jgi:hypothetical protein
VPLLTPASMKGRNMKTGSRRNGDVVLDIFNTPQTTTGHIRTRAVGWSEHESRHQKKQFDRLTPHFFPCSFSAIYLIRQS